MPLHFAQIDSLLYRLEFDDVTRKLWSEQGYLMAANVFL